MEGEITVGASVFTSDGEELGKVKAVEPSAFLVDAPRQFDYWLQASVAASGTAERLDLSITADLVGGYKMDSPHDHNEFRAQVAPGLQPETVRGSILER